MSEHDHTTKVCTKCGNDKPLSEYQARAAKKDGRKSACRDCCNAHDRTSMRDPVAMAAKTKRWRIENTEAANAASKRWRDRNPGWLSVTRSKNPEKYNAHRAQWRRDIRRATPAWANRDAIHAMYVEAARRRAAGEDVHVDHKYPLRGKTVCGLHVHSNLRIIPGIENLRKSNSYPLDIVFPL